MKKLRGLMLFIVSLILLPAMAQVSFGEPVNINTDWKFVLRDVENGQKTDLNDKRWQKVDLPHDWSVKGQLSPSLVSCTGYLPGGMGWYRKNIEIPADKTGEKVYLYFEGVYNRSEVFINGQSLGKRPNGYISFMYDATPYVKYGEENVIAVKVDHTHNLAILDGTQVRESIAMCGWYLPILRILHNGAYSPIQR